MIRNEPRNRQKLASRNGLNIFSKLKNKSVLKTKKRMNQVSEKQKAINKSWREITDEKFAEVGGICLWCGLQASRDQIDGHHIIPRRYAIHTKENNFPCHRWECHQEITDNNIDVRLFPNKLAWENRNNGLRT